MLDVIIVGGGPAGLNAALILGRCRRRVLLCDTERPRNAASRRMNGFLSRDGIEPAEMRRLGREQLGAYPDVELRPEEAVDARRIEGGFEVTLAGGHRAAARRLLLATGLGQAMPDIEGFAEFWGRGTHHCPYCDGWEARDRPLAAFGEGSSAKGLALELLIWSRDVVLLTHGPAGLRDKDRERLDRHGIRVIETPVARLEGEDGLERVRFADGSALDRHAVFFMQGNCPQSPLVERLGCEMTDRGTVDTYAYERTNVPGLYVAGDASRRVQFAVVAAAEGAMAAFAINTELMKEDFA